jgi:hypothetical protein
MIFPKLLIVWLKMLHHYGKTDHDTYGILPVNAQYQLNSIRSTCLITIMSCLKIIPIAAPEGQNSSAGLVTRLPTGRSSNRNSTASPNKRFFYFPRAQTRYGA